ncbi:hypothetical protein [Aquimarina algiphila]|uniref:hypothetical protein n=1 Tax=Aquimarina algiphila TaxID=2047982 RepID=UPI00249184D9|nr:hypothetical protein [Aquimarina algiphila]
MKEKFLQFMIDNSRGIETHDEYAIGKTLGLNREKTDQIIGKLLAEGRIFEKSFGLCNYGVNN